MLIAVWRNKHTKGHLLQSRFGLKESFQFSICQNKRK